MSTRVSERVDDWTDRPFSGGYGALHALADERFSGVVRAGGGELYMTKGTVVGVMGSMDDFADTDGTVYEAPTPALALLAVMQERGGEVRAEYYSEDTSITEVDGKLSDGGFTGYIELSENVLSGDYYVVYHQGRSMSVAFVGNAARLLEDDEAFERANGEVGIYKVHPVDIDPVEIPEPPEPEEDEPAVAETASETDPAGSGETGETDSEATADAEPDTAPGDDEQKKSVTAESEESTAGQASAGSEESTPGQGSAESGERTAGQGSAESGERTAGQASAESEESTPGQASAESEQSTPGQASAGSEESTPETARASTGSEGATVSDTGGRSSDAGRESGPGTTGRADTRGSPSAESGDRHLGSSRRDRPAEASTGPPTRATGEQEGDGHLETRSIPSLDPERTRTDDRGQDSVEPTPDDPLGPARTTGGNRQPGQDGGTRPGRPQEANRQRDTERSRDAGTERGTERSREAGAGRDTERAESASGSDTSDSLAEDLADREAEIERLESDLETATEEKSQLESELASVREERDELQAEIERLEDELDRLEEEYGAPADGERRITPQEALDGTDIFVRYGSKGDATLAKAHGGAIRQQDVVDNLALETHTQFDADSVVVGKETYEEYIEGTVAFQFVEWVAEELLFEIRDTGQTDALETLYDALPKIDRAELNGTVDVNYTEEGQETRSTEAFDVVYRNRMGDPLLVANVNDAREAATQSMMESLVTAGERVGQSNDEFAAAFLVTTSFFEPGALETASEATRSGLLSRSKRKSFVNLSRKRGYHLCLVEARDENFTLAVPEL